MIASARLKTDARKGALLASAAIITGVLAAVNWKLYLAMFGLIFIAVVILRSGSSLLPLILAVSIATERMEQFIPAGPFFLSPIRIVLIGSVACLLFRPGWKAAGPAAKRYLALVILLLAAVLISVYPAADKLYSFGRFINFGAYFYLCVLSYALSRKKPRLSFNALLKAWYPLTLVTSLLALIQITGFLLPEEYLARTYQNLRPVLGIPLYRSIGLFLDPNFLGSYMAATFTLLLAAPGISLAGIGPRNIKLFTLGLTFLALIATNSRGSFTALAFGLAFFLSRKLDKKSLAWLVIAGLLVLYLIPFLTVVVDLPSVVPYISSFDSPGSGISRLYIWYANVKLILSHPLLGVGPGNLINVEKGALVDFLPVYERERLDPAASHSVLLEVTGQSGIIAGILYLFSVVYLILLYRKIPAKQPSVQENILLTTLFTVFVSQAFISYQPAFAAILTGLLLASCERGNIPDDRGGLRYG